MKTLQIITMKYKKLSTIVSSWNSISWNIQQAKIDKYNCAKAAAFSNIMLIFYFLTFIWISIYFKKCVGTFINIILFFCVSSILKEKHKEWDY